jgi:GT2 family glycosyltransferase
VLEHCIFTDIWTAERKEPDRRRKRMSGAEADLRGITPQDVDVVILNYRTPELSVRAAKSAFVEGATSVFIVDNCSRDNSVEKLAERLGGMATVIERPENGGFAAGNNAGALLGDRPVILFLNSDAFLVPGALHSLCEVLNRDPRIAAVGPALYYEDGSPQPSASLRPTPWRITKTLLKIETLGKVLQWGVLAGNTDLRRNGTFSGQVETLYGPCLLIRRDAFEESGGFDERFFLYYEETDLLVRLRQSGWDVHRDGTARAIHAQGGSAEKASTFSTVIMQESRRIYSRKHFGVLGIMATSVASMLWSAMGTLLSVQRADRLRYWSALGVWLGWTASMDPRKQKGSA